MSKPITTIKRTANGARLLSDGSIVTPVCRLAFVHIDEPWSGTGGGDDDDDNPRKGKGKYTVTALFRKGEDLSILKLAAQRARKQKWGDKIPARYTDSIRKQDEKVDQYDGFVKGAFFMNCGSKFKPQIIGPTVSDSFDEDGIYSGCYCRLNLNTYAYGGEKRHKGNNGVSFGLQKIQFIRDGDRLTGGSPADEVFEDETGDSPDDDDLL